MVSEWDKIPRHEIVSSRPSYPIFKELMNEQAHLAPDPGRLYWSAQESIRFALSCLEPIGENLRARSSFVDPEGRPMRWHDFGDLEGPGWAANAIGGAHLLYRWGRFIGDVSLQRQALQLLDHVLMDGFLQPDGLILPYYHLAQERFCLNYTHRDDWLCPGSLAHIGVQLLEFANDLEAVDPSKAEQMRQAAEKLSAWLARHTPRLPNGWVPRRITASGEAYRLSPSGAPDPIFDHSADGLFLLQLWALTGRVDFARQLGDAFIAAGGMWGSLNHDTFDDHENVAYAVAFRVFRQVSGILDRPGWVPWAYDHTLPAMQRFRLERDEHGVATRGLFWMEQSWDTAYLWENAEIAQAFLEAWLETGYESYGNLAIDTLTTIAKHHYGSLGFLSEGVDWNNHVSQRHHIHRAYYGAIRYTEPLLNNLHLVLPTLTYLEASGALPPEGFLPMLKPTRAEERSPEPTPVRYLLRLFYPVLETDESVSAVLQFIWEAGIDGVLLFESNYDTDPALLTLDVLEKRFARLKEITPRFREAGLEVHINVEITMGHVDAGGGQPQRFSFQFQVNEQGLTSRSSACPLDPRFLDYAGQIYRWAAQCGADAVWVDDDTRFLYHDLPGMACFCPLHLAEMSRRTDKDWKRDELVAALQDDMAAQLRQVWFDLQEEAMLRFSARVESEIHSVDPRQAVGLMSIGTIPHAAEGRHTDRMLRALAGENTTPMLRPGSGFWCDWEPASVIAKTEDVTRQVHFLGRDVRLAAEIENHPYTPYAKSLRILALEFALNILAGIPELSLNILNSTTGYDPSHSGHDYAAFLHEQKPFLESLSYARQGKLRQGIGVEANEDIARRMPLRGRSLTAWLEPRPWEMILARLGLPVGLPQDPPHLLAGDIVYTIDRAAMESILQDGAVFTPTAVRGLLELGWGDRLGVRRVDLAPAGINEYFTSDQLNGCYSTARLQVRHYAHGLAPHRYEFNDDAKVRVLSRWVDIQGADQGVAAAALELHGNVRLGLLPFEIQTAAHPVLQLARRAQWEALFEWVARKPLPCKITGGVNLFPQVFADPLSGETLLAVTNLSADDTSFQYRIPGLPSEHRIQRLDEHRIWISQENINQVQVKAWSLVALKMRNDQPAEHVTDS